MVSQSYFNVCMAVAIAALLLCLLQMIRLRRRNEQSARTPTCEARNMRQDSSPAEAA